MRSYHGMEVAWANRLVHTARVDFGQVKYLRGGYCGPRRQRDYQMIVIGTGCGEVSVDDAVVELPADHAVLFLPGHREHFRFSAAQETEHVWCAIRPHFVPADLRWRLLRAPRMVPCSELMHRLFAAAQSCRAVENVAAGHVVEHLGLALFAEYLHRTSRWTQRVHHDEALNRARAWIEDHYDAEDCLAQARHAAKCSESALNDRFRRLVGTSPARYMWHTRVERGIALLRDTGLTVAEVSSRCGCKNQFHFSRLVKRSLGISPREVRRRAWQ